MCKPYASRYPQQGQQAHNPYNPPPVIDKSKVAAEAAIDLARLMERQLGYDPLHIDPIALRLFIRAYWSRVSAFAHSIHDE